MKDNNYHEEEVKKMIKEIYEKTGISVMLIGCKLNVSERGKILVVRSKNLFDYFK